MERFHSAGDSLTIVPGAQFHPVQRAFAGRWRLRFRALSKMPKTAAADSNACLGLAQREGSAIGTDRSAVETGDDFSPAAGFKSETRSGTLFHSEGRFSLGANCCAETQLCHEGRRFAKLS